MSLSIHSDEHFMKLALEQAKIAFSEGEIPVGAVVVVNNTVISKAYNQVEKLSDPTAHAEILAITAACNHLGAKYLDECTLYVTLEPCTMCGGASQWAQLKKIVFAASDQKRGYSVHSKLILHPKCEVVSGIMKEESEKLLLDFFQKLRN